MIGPKAVKGEVCEVSASRMSALRGLGARDPVARPYPDRAPPIPSRTAAGVLSKNPAMSPSTVCTRPLPGVEVPLKSRPGGYLPIMAVATSRTAAPDTTLVSPTASQIGRLDRTSTGQQMQEMFWEEILQRRLGPAQLAPPTEHDAARAASGSCAASNHVWRPDADHLSLPQLWQRLRAQATTAARGEPVLAMALQTAGRSHASLAVAVASLLASKLASRTLLATPLTQLLTGLYADDLELLEAASADMQATTARDPACEQELHCLLFSKGWQATQAHRAAHALWARGRAALALALQSRCSETFGVDIHPAARLGRGLLLDHGVGIVVGGTGVMGDNVSLMQGVTLGGSGTGKGRRHPTVEHACLISAGASVLGPVRIGHCSRVGAGSIVVADVPPHSLAVGVPARSIRHLPLSDRPCDSMEQGINGGEGEADYII